MGIYGKMKSMKKLLFTILILFIASCSKEISLDRIVERNDLAYEVNSQTPYNGKALIYFDNGQVEYQVTYKNGELVKKESYYENGQLQYKGVFENGEHIKEEGYYENGQLQHKGAYKNDELVKGELYYENGQLQYKGLFENGEPVKEESYYENGQLKYKGVSENGKLVKEEGPYYQDDKIIKNMETNMTLVTIKTSVGEIKLELDDEKAPITVENFKTIANSGYYEGTIFHRVINGFMVQGGGLTAYKDGKTSGLMPKASGTAPIQNEANNGLSNDRGTIAMARTPDPHSATSQFFINHKDNEFLNHTAEKGQGWGYAVFGKVTEGMDIVDQIADVETGSRVQYDDVPVDVITIESVTISE